MIPYIVVFLHEGSMDPSLEIQNYPGRKRNLTYISVDPGGQVNGIMSADA